jgi:methionyl-tRNA formyltransferase
MVTPESLRVLFFGTPAFAVPTLDALLQSSHHVVGVVTRADRPRGRGHRTTDAPVKVRARASGIPVLQPERLQDPAFLSAAAALDADLGVVVAYGKLLNDAVLAMPRLGLINVHGSLLPRYRGAAPVHRAVIAGEGETGITIMRVVKALDAGPVLAAIRRPIGPEETSEEVERDLARIGAPLLVSVVDALASGPVTEEPQDESAASYAHRLTRDLGLVDWRRPAAAIHNLVRGLHPWPHAFTFLDGRRLILLRSHAERSGTTMSGVDVPGVSTDPPGPSAANARITPGTILEAAGDLLRVATGEGTLAIAELQAEGRRPMPAREFLAGTRISAGDVLTKG